MSINDIEKAVASLPPDRYAEFRAWFVAFDADFFDRKIEPTPKPANSTDSPIGRLATYAIT